jgi:hypothetical protein
MVDHDTIRSWIAEHNDEALLADGFEAAIIGVGERGSGLTAVIYDRSLCISILMQRGMTCEDAEEYIRYNVLGGSLDENGPIFLWRYPDLPDYGFPVVEPE